MKKNTSKDLILIASALLLGLTLMATPYISRGQTTVTTDGKYTVLVPLPCIEGNGISCEGRNGALQDQVDFKTYVQYTFNLFIGLSAATAVVMIIWGSVEYIVSSSLYDKKSGLEKAKNAVYGLILVLTSFIILRTVDPRFTQIPNTIVPQITYETYLLDNPYRKLFEAIESDSSKLTLRGIQIGQNIQESRQNVASATEKLNLTNSSLEDLKKNASTTADQEKIKQLELQRKTELDALNQAKIQKIVGEFEININAELRSAVDLIANLNKEKSNPDDVAETMKQLNTSLSNIDTFKDKAVQNISELGPVNKIELNNRAYYGQFMLSIYKLKLSNYSTSYTTGMFNLDPGKYKVEFVAEDASLKEMSREGVKKYLTSTLQTLKGQSSYFDVKYKKEIEAELSNIENDINENPKLK
jgi:hypothetical protein